MGNEFYISYSFYYDIGNGLIKVSVYFYIILVKMRGVKRYREVKKVDPST